MKNSMLDRIIAAKHYPNYAVEYLFGQNAGSPEPRGGDSVKSAYRILFITSVCFVVGGTGCSKKETPAPPVVVDGKPALPKVEAELPTPAPKVEDTGTVKIEFDIAVDPRSIITVSGNDFSPKELEQPITLKPGTHTIVVKPSGRELAPQKFTVEKGQRRIVRVYDPERRAAEWVLRNNGRLRIMVDGQQREVKMVADLPQTNFTVAMIGLGFGKINDSDLEHLEGLTQLKQLGLHDTPITDRGLAHLRGLTELGELDLKRAKITDAGLEQLKGLTRLGQLELTGVPITDSGVAHLKALKGLYLLYLTAAKVTDTGVADLKGLTELVYLHLEDTQVTDACLVHLQELKKLKLLGLNGTNVTDAGVAEIKAALPKCDVKR